MERKSTVSLGAHHVLQPGAHPLGNTSLEGWAPFYMSPGGSDVKVCLSGTET